VPHGPHLESGSKASKEAARKTKNDAGARLAGKRVKLSGWKATTTKAPVAPKSMGAASSKATSSKAAPSQMKSVPKAGAAPRASVPLKAGAPT
jgi:hypothetical protein